MKTRLILALVAMIISTVASAAEQQVYPLRPEVNMPYQPKTSHKNTTGPSSATATATANPTINVKVYITNSSACGGAPCPVTTRQHALPSRPTFRSEGRKCTPAQSLASTPYPEGKKAVPRWNPRRNCCDWWVIG